MKNYTLLLLILIVIGITGISCTKKQDPLPRFNNDSCPVCTRHFENQIKPGTCFYCSGDTKCTYCEGTGKREVGKNENFYTETCPHCNASGKCHYCEGSGKCKRCKGSGKWVDEPVKSPKLKPIKK